MNVATSSGDAELLDLLRSRGPVSVIEMASAIEVTPTAIRQRLTRLTAQRLIQREPVRVGRGRPSYEYQLSQKGKRLSGSNFTDLALVLWREIGAIDDPAMRRHLIERVIAAMAGGYADDIEGRTTTERMRSLSRLLGERQVLFSVESNGDKPVLTAHACPYPELADQDPEICSLEKMLFSELLGEDVVLSQCRLNGASQCQFQTK